MTGNVLSRRALRIQQHPQHALYLLALTADELLQIADVSRVGRNDMGDLIGYQRDEVRAHVREISDYLNEEEVLFPNPIIIAITSVVHFRASRGPGNSDGHSTSGHLEIPIPGTGLAKPGWIVDGQQRTLALSKSRRHDFPVPVNAFVADTIDMQRDQFLRINNSRPLPRGLVTELLPEVDSLLPPRLAVRRIPAEICELLNKQEDSPFQGLIRRASGGRRQPTTAVIQDTSVITMIQESLVQPSGCLFPYRNLATNETDFEPLWRTLILYWSAVREVFPEAWGRAPRVSRLMGGVGIRAMGRLMDRVMGSVDVDAADAQHLIAEELELIAPLCAWTGGDWEGLGIAWSELQNVPRHATRLSNFLIREYVKAKVAAR